MSDDLFYILLSLSALWIVGLAVGSAIYRRNRGKRIWTSAPADADFVEAGCSGRSDKNPITGLGGAGNCLLVYVASGDLVVTPMFPFTLWFLPEIFGLDCRAPKSRVIAHTEPALFGARVRIEFADGGEGPYRLRMRNPDGLIAALSR